MTREEVDMLWFQAMRDSAEAGEQFSRYHFAALVAAAEREACAKAVEIFDKTFQTGGGIAGSIRARGEK